MNSPVLLPLASPWEGQGLNWKDEKEGEALLISLIPLDSEKYGLYRRTLFRVYPN